jgi:hypothetical protein
VKPPRPRARCHRRTVARPTGTWTPSGDAEPDRARTKHFGARRRPTSGGARGVERHPGDRKGNPLKGEPQERRRYETRPAGLWGEEGVKRLRKPEDAAKPGQANPVQVAPHHLKRCRGKKPQESVSVLHDRARAARDGGRSGSGHTLEQSEAHERTPLECIIRVDLEPAERPRRPTPRGAKVREGSSTHRTIPRTLARL